MDTWLDILKRLVDAHNVKNPKHKIYLTDTDLELVIQFSTTIQATGQKYTLRRKIDQNEIGGLYDAAQYLALHLFSRGIMQPL
jgi:hypothetical protein